MEESKLVRTRTTTGIPREAIRYCLERAGTGWSSIECVAVANRPARAWARQAWLRTRLTPFAPVPSGYYQTKALGELGRELNNGRLLQSLGESGNLRVLHLEHHLCHAASALYASEAGRAGGRGPCGWQSCRERFTPTAHSTGDSQAACRERPAGLRKSCGGTCRAIPKRDGRKIAGPRGRIISESRRSVARGKKYGI